MNKHRKPAVNLVIQKNGKKDYSTFYEGIYDMTEQTADEFGLELLLNLGNFSSLRIISRRHGDNVEKAKEEIVDDLLALKDHFLANSDKLLA